MTPPSNAPSDRPAGPIRVLLADDQTLLRSSLRLLIDRERDLEVVGEARDGREAIDLAATTEPDVVLMDLRMPRLDGIAATRAISDIARADGGPRILVLSMFDDDELVLGALAAGAGGFVLKDLPPDELLEAVRRTANGDAQVSPAVLRRLIRHVTASATAGPRASTPGASAARVVTGRPPADVTLTPRERDVLSLVTHGCTNDEIATRLGIGRATVKTHVANLLTKFGARDRVQLVILAFRLGLAT